MRIPQLHSAGAYRPWMSAVVGLDVSEIDAPGMIRNPLAQEIDGEPNRGESNPPQRSNAMSKQEEGKKLGTGSKVDRRKFIAGTAATAAGVALFGGKKAYGAYPAPGISIADSQRGAALGVWTLGISLEKNVLTGGLDLSNLKTYMENAKLSKGYFRIGGSSVDTYATIPQLKDYFNNFANPLQLKTIYGVDLYPSYPNADTLPVSQYNGTNFVCFEMGNEPDVSDEGDNVTIYSIWQSQTNLMINNDLYGLPYAGPAVARWPYWGNSSQPFFSLFAHANVVTGHYYFAPGDGTNWPDQRGLNWMTDPTAIDAFLKSTPYNTGVTYLGPNGDSQNICRFGECGSQGFQGNYQDKQAGALRCLDIIFQAGYAGITGFNFHTNNGSAYSVIDISSGDTWATGYALSFAQNIILAGGGALYQIDASFTGVSGNWVTDMYDSQYSTTTAVNTIVQGPINSGNPNVSAYAFKHTDGVYSLLISNKTPDAITFAGTSAKIKQGATQFASLVPSSLGDSNSDAVMNLTGGFAGAFEVPGYSAVWYYDVAI